jgi:DNA-binding HxlR family transcriptional regulator
VAREARGLHRPRMADPIFTVPYILSAERPVPTRPAGDAGDAGRTRRPHRPSPMETALDLLDGRRKPLLVWHLFWGPRAFGELLRLTGGTKRVLRQELTALEACGLLCKEQRIRDSRRAEYRLTSFGETLKPLLGAFYAWGLFVQESRPSAAIGAGRPSVPPEPAETRRETATRVRVRPPVSINERPEDKP